MGVGLVGIVMMVVMLFMDDELVLMNGMVNFGIVSLDYDFEV